MKIQREKTNSKSTDDGERNETKEIARKSRNESQSKSATRDVKTIDKRIHTIANSRAKINSKSTDDSTRNKKKFRKKSQIKSVARDEKTFNHRNHSGNFHG